MIFLDESSINWEELIEVEDITHEELAESIKVEINENQSTKNMAIKNIAKDFDFGEKIEVELFENIVENIYTIKENVNFKFPQANNINISVLALEIIINEMTPNNNGVTKDDIAELLGFTERQGSYYGDLLVYLGFLSKDNSKYYPTKLSKEYKQETNRKERNIIILKSMVKHKSIKEYFLLFHTNLYVNKSKLKDNLYEILKRDPLMSSFSESTIKRRGSTVEAMATWSNKIIETKPKPFVKWAGGKQRVLPLLLEYLPDPDSYDKYIEPFAGGAAMFYHLQQKHSILNDYNKELINTYQQIKTNVAQVEQALNEYENTEEKFYEIRNMDRNPINFMFLNDSERAARFIFLNKTCFNGLYRVNKNGEFNTPYGHNPNAMFKIFDLLKVNSKLYNKLNTEFYNGDYKDVLKFANNKTFVYFDPPYDPISKTSNFTSYTDSGFDQDEQIRLKKSIDELTERGVKIMLSNSDTEFIKNLYSQDIYNIYKIEVYRNIASKNESRKVVSEVVITNY